jgi:FkbM family methyltransferase
MGVAAVKGWIITGKGAVKAWVGLVFLGYVVLRVLLRLLIGKRRRDWVQDVLRLYFDRGYSVKYGSLLPWYEADVRRIIKNVLSKPHSQTFIDIGAFLGWHTVTAYKILRKRKVFRIVAVEPDPTNYRELERRIRVISGDSGSIQLVNEAVFVSDGEEIDFHVEKVSGGMSGSVFPTECHVKDGYLSGERIRVRTVRLDTLIKRFGLERVDLIKMDIEGAEYPVLTDPSLDLSRVENIVVEVHYRYGSRESQEIIRALAKHGFKIVPLYPDQTSRYHRLLACRGEVPW